VRRRETEVIAPIVVLGSVLAFMELTFAKGGSFGWLRFQITGIPLVVLLAGALLTRPALARSAAEGPVWRRLVSRQWTARMMIIGGVALAIPVTLHAFYDPVLSREENQQFIPAVRRLSGAPHPVLGQMNIYGNEQAIARYLDGLKLPDGSVLTDDALSFPIVLASSRPRQFVITSDRDFYDAVAHPTSAGIRYILVSADEGSLDVISAVYPSLYDSGARIGRVYRSFPSRQAGGRAWRIIAVTTSPRSIAVRP
jgi:hypothetical protein